MRDSSGACVLVVMIIGNNFFLFTYKDDMVYVANVGDCRAVSSKYYGKRVSQLTRDHKPDDKFETNRIKLAGGSVYQ